jgi:translation initiation factor 2B subunit (eIF-2B alpha/beta/delta family)
MTGSGLFRHNKKSKKVVKKVIDALEGEMEGKGLLKSVKKGVSKGAKSVAKTTKNVVKDVSKEIQKDAEESLMKTISKVKNQARKAVPPEAIETIDLVKKSVKAVKKFDMKKIDKIIADIPDFYKDEIKNTYVGQMIREALVVGTDIAVDSAIQAMYSNPYTAPLAPLVQIAWETEQQSGQPMTRGVIEKVGLGLGLGLRAGNGLRASGKGLRVGAGLMAGSGNKVEMIKHKVDPFYLENKLTNQPTDKQKIVKQTTHEDKLIMGQGGGAHITGLFLQAPVMSGILKPRPLKRVSIIQGQHQ